MNRSEQQVFDLIKVSLFTHEGVALSDWQSVFAEMKNQSVAALPGEWLKSHPVSETWSQFCVMQQCQWVKVMYVQNRLILLLESHDVPSVIIKGAAAAVYYPHPTLRSMGDIDLLVRRRDLEKAAKVLEENGYKLILEKDHADHHYNYVKDGVSIELHKRLPVVDDGDEELLALFENGIGDRVWKCTEGCRFPVLPEELNGLVLIFHINQHLREGLGLRQIIDWMLYVRQLSLDRWDELRSVLKRMGMEKLALTVNAMCGKYLGMDMLSPETDDALPVEELMGYILEKGNFGRKAGVEGKEAAFALSSTEKGGFFRRLQAGGLSRWEAAKKHRALRPFAWLYQMIRILRILIQNKFTLQQVLAQREKAKEQRKLILALGLQMDRTIQTNRESA